MRSIIPLVAGSSCLCLCLALLGGCSGGGQVGGAETPSSARLTALGPCPGVGPAGPTEAGVSTIFRVFLAAQPDPHGAARHVTYAPPISNGVDPAADERYEELADGSPTGMQTRNKTDPEGAADPFGVYLGTISDRDPAQLVEVRIVAPPGAPWAFATDGGIEGVAARDSHGVANRQKLCGARVVGKPGAGQVAIFYVPYVKKASPPAPVADDFSFTLQPLPPTGPPPAAAGPAKAPPAPIQITARLQNNG